MANMPRNLLRQVMETYVRKLPYHPGKWRVIEGLVRLGQFEKLDEGKIFEVEWQGVRWKLQTTCAIQRKLLYHGFIDPHECRELLARLPAQPVFFDIGAYFGWYSFLLASRRGATAYAFEPLPANYALLAEHQRLNHFPDVHSFPIALCDQPGEVSFHVPGDDNRGTGRILAEGGLRIPATTLDAFVEEHGIRRIDAMKIDVEGAEVRVLSGGRETIRKFRPSILIEVNPRRLEMLGTSAEALLAALREFDYGLFSVTGRGLKPFVEQPGDQEYFNLLCLRR